MIQRESNLSFSRKIVKQHIRNWIHTAYVLWPVPPTYSKIWIRKKMCWRKIMARKVPLLMTKCGRERSTPWDEVFLPSSFSYFSLYSWKEAQGHHRSLQMLDWSHIENKFSQRLSLIQNRKRVYQRDNHYVTCSNVIAVILRISILYLHSTSSTTSLEYQYLGYLCTNYFIANSALVSGDWEQAQFAWQVKIHAFDLVCLYHSLNRRLFIVQLKLLIYSDRPA